MAANTFLEMSRSLKLYCPSLPITLAEQMVRDRYRRILERRPWSGLRGEGQFLFNVAKSAGTVAITFGSPTVVGTGTSFDVNDITRQFVTGSGGVRSIINVQINIPGNGQQTLTLDDNIGVNTNVAATYKIFDGYVTAPADFMRFIAVVDPVRGYRVRHWVTQDELMRMDPQRNFFGNPYALVDRRFSSFTSTVGLVQYEAWPYTLTQQTLTYHYIQQGLDLLNPTDTPLWPIRSDAIVSGALADMARWPGTKEEPNPYFARPDAWMTYEKEYEDKMIDLERQDEDIYTTWMQSSQWSSWPFFPISANFIQSHAI